MGGHWQLKRTPFLARLRPRMTPEQGLNHGQSENRSGPLRVAGASSSSTARRSRPHLPCKAMALIMQRHLTRAKAPLSITSTVTTSSASRSGKPSYERIPSKPIGSSCRPGWSTQFEMCRIRRASIATRETKEQVLKPSPSMQRDQFNGLRSNDVDGA